MTQPVASYGAITCQAPRSAAARSTGSRRARSWLSGAPGPARTTSSVNVAMAFPSIRSAEPIASALGCRRACVWPVASAKATAVRSPAALIRNAHPCASSSAEEDAANQSRAQYTISSLSGKLSAQFSMARPTRRARPLIPHAPVYASVRSTSARKAFSSARSRYTTSLSASPASSPPGLSNGISRRRQSTQPVMCVSTSAAPMLATRSRNAFANAVSLTTACTPSLLAEFPLT
mmetsp:Transcript_13379/g.41988  ORF Transcript_13379/g.41988 Transcript_13379/m.41988 type:complete len:234 (-) Transcript_13379:798-1499(-)